MVVFMTRLLHTQQALFIVSTSVEKIRAFSMANNSSQVRLLPPKRQDADRSVHDRRVEMAEDGARLLGTRDCT